LNKQLQRAPEYQAARFLQAAAICCRDGVKKGRRAFNEIKDDVLSAEVITIAGEELAKTLTRAGRLKNATNIKKATSG
ncbi:MAG: hypothetical protein U9Q58_07910, partial [Pseudomonadota bacterium]|nr:hypothetical protein [Pseudomonadota bacterium]